MPSFPSLMVQRYNKIEKQRDFKAPQALSGDTELTARAANVLNSVAKVQHNFETTKDKEQKKLPPVTPLGTNRRGISQGRLEEWRAVYQSLSEVVPSSDMPRHTDVPGTLAASLICRKALF